MKNLLLGFVLASFLYQTLFANDFSIKSLRTYSSDYEDAFPIVMYSEEGNKNNLVIEFDIEAEYQPNLIIQFKFCDRNWTPYESAFFANEGYNTAYSLWFETLPASIEGADYHYSDSFPNYDVTFPFSGKWIYNITETGNGNVYATGKFYVVKPELSMIGQITKDQLENTSSDFGIYSRTNRVSAEFILPDELYPGEVQFVEIVKNQVIEYPYIVGKNEYDDNRYYEWDGSRRFKFAARDILPGNEYRSTDFRDTRRFFSAMFDAQIDGTEISRIYTYGGRDLNGRSQLTNFKDYESDYFFVKFSIRPPEKIYNNIYLTGSFNNWQVLPQYRLEEYSGLYEIDVELKRGRYDYLYVTGDEQGGTVTNINWNSLEGNFWETNNDYYIFLFYNPPEYGGYDKIIGFIKLSGEAK